MPKSLYFYLFKYIYSNCSPEQKKIIRSLLEKERIKRQLEKKYCSNTYLSKYNNHRFL